MKLSNFNFELPSELIAQEPANPRDHSRFLVVERDGGGMKSDSFYNLPRYLKKGDVLVLNNSKVFPARLLGQKSTGGKVEIFLERQAESGHWLVLGRNIGRAAGQKITFHNSRLSAKILERSEELYLVEFNLGGEDFFKEIEKIGHTPLPPYIKRTSEKEDKKSYQTIFAKDRGSVAAPTAGLHFTEKLFEKLKSRGVEVLELTLHVGLGTFAPVKTEKIEDHKIHTEYFSITKEVLEKIQSAKKEGRRIIAVGTTTTRVLEHLFSCPSPLTSCNLSGWTNIFIYPGYEFKCIDGIVTNFHLPKSSLLMLVSAFAGKRNIDKAYRHAIEQKYRFYSYGDAMLII